MAAFLAMSLHGHANAAPNLFGFDKIVGQAKVLVQLAAVDLPKILPYIMGKGDVFQGYETTTYKNRRALKLRIFNQQSGRVRYIYVDAETGRIL